MSSFYGGKQGRTYHLVTNYGSVQEMVTQFAKGGSYTEVNYGQYVIIDTPSKEDPENGCIYRRGFNYKEQSTNSIQNPGAGAIYIGKISGPTGKTPDIAATATVNTTATAISISHEEPSRDGVGNITTANLKFTFPAYSLSTARVESVAPDQPPSVTVEPNSTNPFAPIATIQVPVGRHGNSIDNVTLNNDGSITANITTYAKDNSSTTTAASIGSIIYPESIAISTVEGKEGDIIQTFVDNSFSTIGHFRTISSIVSKDSNIEIYYNDTTTASVIPVGSQFHVQGIYNSLNELKTEHPQGFPENSGHEGWIAVVNEVEDDVQKKKFYAYDHRQGSTVGWYEIGAIGTAQIDEQIVPDKIMVISDSEPIDPITSSSNLKVGGYWFVLSQ